MQEVWLWDVSIQVHTWHCHAWLSMFQQHTGQIMVPLELSAAVVFDG